jgi:peptidoglycan/xylan/chitin deacetylase (PgdA/CDA1 family)
VSRGEPGTGATAARLLVGETDRPRWPDGARCAVMLSFDLDGPALWLDEDPGAWHRPRVFSLGSYGPWRALPRILSLLADAGAAATFFVPGWIAETWPDRVRGIAESGHELGHHGYLHELFYGRPVAEQRDILTRCAAIFRDVAGVTPAGFRTPSGDASTDTFALLEELGFGYSSSMRGDDRPYRWVLDGRLTDLIEIPARWELDDFPQFGYNDDPPTPAGLDRIASIGSTLRNWKREFDGYYQRGLCYVLILHPQLIGTPGRMQALENLLTHIRSRPGAWIATGSEIAAWWRKLNPA